MGRGNPKIGVRFDPAELAQLQLIADAAGVTLSALIRNHCRKLIPGVKTQTREVEQQAAA